MLVKIYNADESALLSESETETYMIVWEGELSWVPDAGDLLTLPDDEDMCDYIVVSRTLHITNRGSVTVLMVEGLSDV